MVLRLVFPHVPLVSIPSRELFTTVSKSTPFTVQFVLDAATSLVS